MRAIILAIIMILVPFSTMSVSAISAFSDNGQTNDITWMHGISGTTFVGYNGSSLQLIDIENGTVYQSVPCSYLSPSYYWRGGPVKISADGQYFMCGSERYQLVGLTLVNLSFSTSPDNQFISMDVKSGFKTQWVRPDSCWNKHDGDGTLSIMNGSAYVANVTAVRDGSNGVIIESMHLYEDNPYKMLVIFAANDGGDECDDSVNRRYLSIDFNSSTQVNFGHTRGSELSGCTQGLYVHNRGAVATHWGGSQCTSVTWFDLDSANPWNGSAKKGVDSWMDSNSGGAKYHWSASPDCWMAGRINSNSSADLQHIMMNGTRFDVSLSQYSGKDIDAVACTSHENGIILIDGTWYTYWRDSDTDGVNDFEDAFPNDATQTEDIDGDGFGDSFSGFQADACTNQPGTSFHDRFGCPDMDNDGWSDQSDAFPNIASQWNDTDGDGYGDNSTGWKGDSCPSTYGDSNKDKNGCPDDDLDGWSNDVDVFDSDSSQWNDTDSDGWGDNGAGLDPDSCPTQWGNSSLDRYGCPDFDGDGWSDFGDDLPSEPTQWKDRDGDGYGDNEDGENADAFPSDGTQWIDADGDGHGDNPYGSEGDWFPLDPTRWQDSDRDGFADEDDAFVNDATQWNDSDGDGYGDNPEGYQPDAFIDDNTEWDDTDGDGIGNNADAFPFDPTQTVDADGDGYGDNSTGNNADAFIDDNTEWDDTDGDGIGNNADAFPFDPTQTVDTDGDGYGDNADGTLGDAFPNDPYRHTDSDGDSYDDSSDAFPFDPTQWSDADGDGMGDNPMGIGADKFPNDPTQWGDIDGDGYGDNSTGNNPDAFITDPTQWSDVDGDGYGDNLAGRLPDLFPNNPTQWEDFDGDGLGDNQNGTDADPYLNDFDNDGYNDSIDILPKLASPNDLDNDGCLDDVDLFPDNFNECFDNDGDGIGDNSDTDDDNDGWSDMDEDRLGTDVYSGDSVPVESFEIVLPGTTIGLGAWDLMGIFGGVPLFTWLAFCLVTRQARSRKLERSLFEARSELELSEISDKYEWALLWRLIGPHQALRLERIRSNLEFNMNKIEEEMKEGFAPVSDVINPPSIDAQGVVNTDGYEWTDHMGFKWYRVPNSNADWIKWQ